MITEVPALVTAEPSPAAEAAPQFPNPKTPAGRRSSCPDGGRLHLLRPTDVDAAMQGHVQGLCGRALSTEGFTINNSAGALCLTCIARITPHQDDRDPEHLVRVLTTLGGC